MQTVEPPVIQPSVPERYAMIAALPRPRPLRMSPIASPPARLIIRALQLVALGLIGYLLWSVREFTSLSEFIPAHKGQFFGLGFVGTALLITKLANRQQAKMVANGEVAIATITGRYQANPLWHVWYQYPHKNGQTITAGAMDKTGKKFLVEGQQMFVYYSAENPNDTVAQCESWYEPAINGVKTDPRF